MPTTTTPPLKIDCLLLEINGMSLWSAVWTSIERRISQNFCPVLDQFYTLNSQWQSAEGKNHSLQKSPVLYYRMQACSRYVLLYYIDLCQHDMRNYHPARQPCYCNLHLSSMFPLCIGNRPTLSELIRFNGVERRINIPDTPNLASSFLKTRLAWELKPLPTNTWKMQRR